KHHDRVERAERLIDVFGGEQTDIANASLPGAANRTGRGVDADHLEASILEMEADAAAAASYVEHPSSDESHRLAFEPIAPPRERLDEVSRVEGHDEAVVSLDDLGSLPTVEHVGKDRAIHVVRHSCSSRIRRRTGSTNRSFSRPAASFERITSASDATSIST